MVESKPSGIKWGNILRWTVTIGLLLLLAKTMDWQKLGEQFKHIHPLDLTMTYLLTGVVILLVTIRWWLLLHVQEIRLPLGLTFKLTWIGVFFNNVLPGSVGGDVLRVVYVLKYAPNRKMRAALSVMMDRVIGLLSLLAMAAMIIPTQFSFLSKDPAIKNAALALMVLFASALIGCLVVAYAPAQWIKKLWFLPKKDLFEILVDGLQDHGRKPLRMLQVIAFAILVHLVNFTAAFFLAKSLGIHADFIQLCVILVIVFCMMSLPISVSGHGLREAAAVMMFALYGLITVDPVTGAGKEPAVAFGLLWGTAQILWGLVGGLVYLTYKHQADAVVTTPHPTNESSEKLP